MQKGCDEMKWCGPVLPKSGDRLRIPAQEPHEPARVFTLIRLLNEAPGGDADQELWLAEAEEGAQGRIVLPLDR